jgi:hypothetical protein
VWKPLRAELWQIQELSAFLCRLIIPDRHDLLQAIFQLFPVDEVYLKVLSDSGFIQAYLASTFAAPDPTVVRLGMLIVENFPRIGDVDDG